jgi:hypothetical protein
MNDVKERHEKQQTSKKSLLRVPHQNFDIKTEVNHEFLYHANFTTLFNQEPRLNESL